VVVISGGSRGLGAALVDDFLKRGHVVTTFSRSRSAFIEQRQSADPEAKAFHWEELDGTDHDGVKKFALAVARRYGGIDVLVNNAGLASEGVLGLMRPEEISKLLAVNLAAAIHLTQACSRIMIAKGSGSIIQISSVVGQRGHAGLAVYSATKAALDGMTRSLARELGPRGVRVNSVAPGYFESEMTSTLTAEVRESIVRRTPLKRLGGVADIVAVVRFLAGPDSAFVSGQTLVVDGGYSC